MCGTIVVDRRESDYTVVTEREVNTMMRRVSKIVGNTMLVVSALLGVWVLASWVDVVTHNLNPNPIYQSWNLFALMVGYH